MMSTETDSWWQTVPEIYHTLSIKILPHTVRCRFTQAAKFARSTERCVHHRPISFHPAVQ